MDYLSQFLSKKIDVGQRVRNWRVYKLNIPNVDHPKPLANMRRVNALVLLVLLTLTQVHSKNRWNELIPKGKQVDYNYEAVVNVGMSLPYATVFHLRGVLHVQTPQENNILMRLSDMNFTLDVGKESELTDKTPLRISDDLKMLTTPLRVVFDNNGKIQEIGVDENTSDDMLNMKKALAALFQIDWTNIQLDTTKVQSFKSVEMGLHGNEENIYNIIPTSKTLRIEKLHYMKTSKHLFHNAISNINLFPCDDRFEDPLSHDSQKVYIVDKAHNSLMKVENTGGIYYHNYQTVPPSYRIYITQHLDIIGSHNIETPLQIEKETKVKSLEFNSDSINAPLKTASEKQKLVTVVQRLLADLLEFVETRKIDMSMPDFEREQIPIRLHYVLKYFDLPMFENLIKLLSDPKQLSLLHQMLPYVGTESSIKCLITLIKEKKMPDDLAVTALQELPSSITPNEHILAESEQLLHLEGVSPIVQNTAILCFGSLLQRANKRVFEHHTLISDNIMEKYIRVLMDKLKASTTIEDKQLYLNTLYNTGSPLIIKHLKSVVNGEWSTDNNLRLKAMISLYPLAVKSRDILNPIMWQVMIDRTLPADMRIIAFLGIMKSQPSLSTLINISWIMHSETDVDVYRFYYTFMESMSQAKNPCDREMRLKATQIMKYLDASYRNTLTQYKKVDIFNAKVNTAEHIELVLIDTANALVFNFMYGKTTMGLNTKPMGLYVRITGLHGRLLDDVRLNIKKHMKLISYEQLIQNLVNLPKMENIQVEFMLMKHGRIILADSIQKSNFNAKTQMYLETLQGGDDDSISLDFDLLHSTIIPSDIGFPLMLTGHSVEMYQFPLKFNPDFKNNIFTFNIDGKLKETDHHMTALYVHNPIISTWQGVGKLASHNTEVPVFVDININPQQDMLKISWKRHKNQDEDIWVQRNYVAHLLHNFDYTKSGILQKFNPNAKNFVIVPLNTEDRNKHTIIKTEDFNTGYISRVDVFDTEDSKSLDEISELRRYGMDFSSLLEDWLKNLQFNEGLLSTILQESSLEDRLTMMYRHGVRGVLLKEEPSKTNPVTSVDLSLRFSSEITKDVPSKILPGMKILLKGSYSLRNEENLVKRWDTNINWELNSGHTQNNIKGQLTRTIPGQTDFKICIEGGETYSETGLTGNMNILMSSAPEGTCKKDETSIDITMKGERLPEQLKSRFNFPSCHKRTLFSIQDMPPYSCLSDRTTIRKYEVEITSKHIPQAFETKIISFLEFLKAKYFNHYSVDVSNISEKEKTKLLLTYPISNDILDIEMLNSGRHHKLKALPAANFRKYGLFVPDNLHCSNIQKFTHDMGLVHTCTADTFNIRNVNNTLLSNVVTDIGVLMVGDVGDSPDTGVWIKRVDNKLGLKLVQKMHILLVLPVGNSFTLTVDGRTIPNEPLFSNEWLVMLAEKNRLVVLMKDCGTLLVYNLNEVLLEIPKLNMELAGKCFQGE